MTQFGRRGRLSPQVSAARRAIERTVSVSLGRAPQETDTVLVALSGGPDSLALAAAAAHAHRRRIMTVGAVVVDHQLQEGSDVVAHKAADCARDMGLDPVEVCAVTVTCNGDGLEAAARRARYRALAQACKRYQAHGVLLGHTRDDQAETVLLGLARGSGTRSLSAMAALSTHSGMRVLRPFLELSRQDTVAICQSEQLDPWWDPTNMDQSFLRARVRHTVLPMLERELGPGFAASLARSAAILGPDADELDRQAEELFAQARDAVSSEESRMFAGQLVLSLDVLQGAAFALMRRVLSRACVVAGGQAVTYERLEALTRLAQGRGEAGPVQMAGKVSVYRHRPGAAHSVGTLEFRSRSENT